MKFLYHNIVFVLIIMFTGMAGESRASRLGYTIITSNAIRTASTKLDDFVAHKITLGFNVEVITETDFGDAIGDAAAENIRSWLQDHYIDDNIKYVLFVGNPDPNQSKVPMKMTWPNLDRLDPGPLPDGLWPEDDLNGPTDFYYADLTGNWDLDDDGYYGERWDDFGPGGVDRYWEVLVGRIPYYGNIDETDSILSKTIEYESKTGTLAAAWRKNALIAIKPLGDYDSNYYQMGENFKNNIFEPMGWNYHRIYDEDHGLIPPPEATPVERSIVVSTWAHDTFGFAILRSHGYPGGIGHIIDWTDTGQLNDCYPTFTFQAACASSWAEDPHSLGYSFLKNGGIGAIGGARGLSGGGAGASGQGNMESLGYDYAMRLVAGLTSGGALFDVKQSSPIEPEWDNMSWNNYVALNLYGDPSLSLFPAPTQAKCISPYPGRRNVSLHPLLGWTTGFDGITHDVYFGVYDVSDANSSSASFIGNQAESYFDPGILDPNTTYYWRIDKVGERGTTKGVTWSFNTVVSTPATEFDDATTYWQFEGNLLDATTNDNDGTFAGTPAFFKGKVGSSIYFPQWSLNVDGGPQIGASNDLTVALWVKVERDDGYPEPVKKLPATGTAGWEFLLRPSTENHTIIFRVGSAENYGGWGSECQDTNGYTVGQWVHLAATFNSSTHTAKLYIDGQLRATKTGITDRTTNTQTTGLTLGGGFFSGSLDEFAVWDRVLIDSEIEDVYDLGNVTDTGVPPYRARLQSPSDESLNVNLNTWLRWEPGIDAIWHDLYIGTSQTAVASATTTSAEYMGRYVTTNEYAASLDQELTTYYWRVDEINRYGSAEGQIWSFTTGISEGYNITYGLVGYWPLDGDSLDHSRHNYHGVPHGRPVYTNGKIGLAMRFDGTNDIVDCGSLIGSSESLTVAFWMKSDVDTWFRRPLAKISSTGTTGWAFLQRPSSENNTLIFRIGSEADYGGWGSECQTAHAYVVGQWVHVAGTFDNRTHVARLYINGQEKSIKTNIIVRGVNNTVTPLTMSTTGEKFDGLIDEVAVWNRALTPEEVTGLYHSGEANPISTQFNMNLVDFSGLASFWTRTNCGLCGGADYSGDQNVDIEDLMIIVVNWLQ